MESKTLIRRQIERIRKLRLLGAKTTECVVYNKTTGMISSDVTAD